MSTKSQEKPHRYSLDPTTRSLVSSLRQRKRLDPERDRDRVPIPDIQWRISAGDVLALASELETTPSRILDAIGRVVEESTSVNAEGVRDSE